VYFWQQSPSIDGADDRQVQIKAEPLRRTRVKANAAGKSGATYSDFLQLDILLSLQSMLRDPPQRDELLFIVIHQVSELWLKLMHHELAEARREIAGDELPRR